VDWVSAAITIAAAIALFKYKVGVIRLIAACAAFGLAVKFFNF
jgi:chromate transporter